MRQDPEETNDTRPPGQAFDMNRKALLEEWVVRSSQPQDRYWIVVVPRVNRWPSYLLTAAYPEYPQSHRLAVFFSEYEAEAFIADFCERWMLRDRGDRGV